MIDDIGRFNDLVAKKGLMLTVKTWWKENNSTLPALVVNDWDFDTYYKIYNSTIQTKKKDRPMPKDWEQIYDLNEFAFNGMEGSAQSFCHFYIVCKETIGITKRNKYLKIMQEKAESFDDFSSICKLAPIESDYFKISLKRTVEITEKEPNIERWYVVWNFAMDSGDKELGDKSYENIGKLIRDGAEIKI